MNTEEEVRCYTEAVLDTLRLPIGASVKVRDFPGVGNVMRHIFRDGWLDCEVRFGEGETSCFASRLVTRVTRQLS